MSKIISIHSYRGGTGKSNTTANLATILAMKGLRVGVVDTDIQSPGIHAIFGLEESQMNHSLMITFGGYVTLLKPPTMLPVISMLKSQAKSS